MWLAKVKKQLQIQISPFQELISRVQLLYQPEAVQACRTDLIRITWPSDVLSFSNQLPVPFGHLAVISATNLVFCLTGIIRKNWTSWSHGSKGWQGTEGKHPQPSIWLGALAGGKGHHLLREPQNQEKSESRSDVREQLFLQWTGRMWSSSCSDQHRYAPLRKCH